MPVRAGPQVRLRPRDLRGTAPGVLGRHRGDLGATVGAALILVLIDPGAAFGAIAESVDLRPVALPGAGQVNQQPDAVVDNGATGSELVDVRDGQVIDVTPLAACA